MRAPLELERLNIVDVLEESIARYFDDFNKESREIVFTCHVKKHMLVSNRDMLFRIFDNLIGNAHKHSNGNLEITVKNEEILKIVFTNKLICSNLDMDHIFDEFYTYDISRQKGNTGLGLAIVKQFVMRLGGTVYATTENDDLNIVVEFQDQKKGHEKMSIRIGIMGYGNLGKGIECAIKQNDDMELVAVFTRRQPETLSVLTEECLYILLTMQSVTRMKLTY